MTQAAQHKITDLAIITIVWLLAMLIVQPLGDFPLNDDWAYATDVKNLLQTGSFAPVGWTSMSLLTHVLWGAMCCAIFGFSFEVLRFSSLFIGLICLCNVYFIARELGASRFLALLVAFALGFNPIYFALSFTFMTEISFMVFVSFAALFFIRYLRADSLVSLIFATLFCIIATLSRQTGLFLPFAFIFAFVWKKQKTNPQKQIPKNSTQNSHLSRLSSLVLPLALSFAALKCFEYYMFSAGKTQALYGLQVDELKYLLLNIPEILPLRVVKNTYQASLYLGLMGLPVWIFLSYAQVVGQDKNDGFKPIAFVMIFPILFLIGIIINGSQIPTLIGILEASGIGPRTLYDSYTLQIPTDNLPHHFWQMATYAGALGAGLMWSLILYPVYFLFLKKEKTNQTMWQTFSKRLSPSAVLLLVSATIYFAPFALVGFYDRYLLPLMMVVPLGVVALSREYRTDDFSRCFTCSSPQLPPKGDIFRFAKKYARYSPPSEKVRGAQKRTAIFKTSAISTAVLALILMTIFSIASTHDYLAWNRTRWQALHDLVEKENIPTTHIDGGFEFGGWYNFHEIEIETAPKKSWWWVTENEYILTFSELPSYDTHAEYRYQSWTHGEQHIFVLKEICSKYQLSVLRHTR